MPVFKSQILTASESFVSNRANMLELVAQLQELNQRGAKISAKRADIFAKRGQLMPRERLSQLLDPGMPFMAIGNIAGFLLDTDDPDRSIAGSTVISGIGYVSGVRCVVVVDDPQREDMKLYGGLIAGPIYSRIMERTAAYMSLVPPNPIEETPSEEESAEEAVLVTIKKD